MAALPSNSKSFVLFKLLLLLLLLLLLEVFEVGVLFLTRAHALVVNPGGAQRRGGESWAAPPLALESPLRSQKLKPVADQGASDGSSSSEETTKTSRRDSILASPGGASDWAVWSAKSVMEATDFLAKRLLNEASSTGSEGRKEVEQTAKRGGGGGGGAGRRKREKQRSSRSGSSPSAQRSEGDEEERRPSNPREAAVAAALTSEKTLDAEAWAAARVETKDLLEAWLINRDQLGVAEGLSKSSAAAVPAPAPAAVANYPGMPRNRAAATLYAATVASRLAPEAASAYATNHVASFAAGAFSPLVRAASVSGATAAVEATLVPDVGNQAHTSTVAKLGVLAAESGSLTGA